MLTSVGLLTYNGTWHHNNIITGRYGTHYYLGDRLVFVNVRTVSPVLPINLGVCGSIRRARGCPHWCRYDYSWVHSDQSITCCAPSCSLQQWIITQVTLCHPLTLMMIVILGSILYSTKTHQVLTPAANVQHYNDAYPSVGAYKLMSCVEGLIPFQCSVLA